MISDKRTDVGGREVGRRTVGNNGHSMRSRVDLR